MKDGDELTPAHSEEDLAHEGTALRPSLDPASGDEGLSYQTFLTHQLLEREKPSIKRYEADQELSRYLRHPLMRVLRWYHTYLLIVAFILIGSLSLNAQLSVFYSLFAYSNSFSGAKFFSIVFGIFLAGFCSCFLLNSAKLIQDVWFGNDFLSMRKFFHASTSWMSRTEEMLARSKLPQEDPFAGGAEAEAEAGRDRELVMGARHDTDEGPRAGSGGFEAESKPHPRREDRMGAREGFQSPLARSMAFCWDVIFVQGVMIIFGLDLAPIVLALFFSRGDVFTFFSLFVSFAVYIACLINTFSFVLEIINLLIFLGVLLMRRRWSRILTIPALSAHAGFSWKTKTIVQAASVKANWICFHITINTDAIIVKLIVFGVTFLFLLGCCIATSLSPGMYYIAQSSFLFFLCLYWGFNRIWERGLDFLTLGDPELRQEQLVVQTHSFRVSAFVTPVFLLVSLVYIAVLSFHHSPLFAFVNLYVSSIYLVPYLAFLVFVYPRARRAVTGGRPGPDLGTVILGPSEALLLQSLERFQRFHRWFVRIMCLYLPFLSLCGFFCWLLIVGGGSVLLSVGSALFTLVCIVIVASLIIVTFKHFPKRIFIGFYTLLCGISIALYGALQLYVSENEVNLLPVAAVGPPIPAAPLSYDICRITWGGLGIVDMALFSNLAYQDESVVREDLDVWFNPEAGAWRVNASSVNKAQVQFYEFYNAELDLSVVALRGTTTLLDAVQDLDLWLSVLVLQGIDLFFPTLSIWPVELSRLLVVVSSVNYWINPDLSYFYKPLLDHIEAIPSSKILLTGHSLGGGISRIASAKYHMTSVTFSSPGLDLSRLKFGIDPEADISLDFVNIEPEHDVVPQVDRQTGLRQQIRCDDTPLRCHSIVRTTDVLLASCGDPQGRTFKQEKLLRHRLRKL